MNWKLVFKYANNILYESDAPLPIPKQGDIVFLSKKQKQGYQVDSLTHDYPNHTTYVFVH